MSAELWVAIFAVAAVALGILVRFGLGSLARVVEKLTGQTIERAAWDQLADAVAAAAQRAKDKFLADILAAREPTSDGGAEVTPKELSAARDFALRILLEGLKGSALELAKGLGPAIVKGMIGLVLDKLVKPKLVAKPPAGAPA